MDFREAYRKRSDEIRAQWGRSLPFADAMFDRWERAELLGFGEGASIYNSAFVFGDVTVGKGTWIGPYVMLDGAHAPLSIGSWCSIATGAHLYTHDTVRWALSGGEAQPDSAPTRIGDRCYIGPQTVVKAGVTIGNLSVVGGGSFVNGDIPDRTVVAGSPARPVGRVEGEGLDVRIVHQ